MAAWQALGEFPQQLSLLGSTKASLAQQAPHMQGAVRSWQSESRGQLVPFVKRPEALPLCGLRPAPLCLGKH